MKHRHPRVWHERRNPHRLYRSREDRVIAGVCGGLADYLDISPVLTRLFCLGFFIVFLPIAFIAYIVMAIITPKRPESLYQSEDEEIFWRSVSEKPDYTVGAIRQHLREMEIRLREMEAHVTSKAFRIDSELKKS